MKKYKLLNVLLCLGFIIICFFAFSISAYAQTGDLTLYEDDMVSDNLSDAEAQKVFDFLKTWNKEFIEKNSVIQKADINDREYLIVKTIYNYLITNTQYDEEVYQHGLDEGFDKERYRYAHSSYGALFGNPSAEYNMSYSIDPQGLASLNMRNQGKSVCDGYSLVFYYLCKLNGIDCKIVEGDYIGKPSDPHAWNMVYLCDNDNGVYEWFYVDATFGQQHSNKSINEFIIFDYRCFLRGTDNKEFSKENHQYVYDTAELKNASRDDYHYVLTPEDFNIDKAYVIIDRRKSESLNVLERRHVLSPAPNRKWFRIEDNNKLISDSGFVYNGKEYYYSVSIPYLADGIEVKTQYALFKDAGEYSIMCKNSSGADVIETKFSILPLDMGVSYDKKLTSFQESAMFIGDDITVTENIYDPAGRKLVQNTDYIIKVYHSNDHNFKNPVIPHNIGKYVVRIHYYGNYSGIFQFDDFEVTKADLSKLSINSVTAQFGTDLAAGCAALKIGDTYIYKDKDYKVDIIGSQNYGSSGVIRITALSSSGYLSGGTYADRKYSITSRYNVSALFNNKYISNPHYNYTGKAVKPNNFSLYYSLNGQRITLKKDIDYKISSYSNNVNAGTGYINVTFLGNYSGTAKMKFYIDCTSFDVSISDLTYNGKNQTPSPVVKCGGIMLKRNTNYTVSGYGNTPGIYQCKIQGKGKYSKISISKVFFIKPKKISGLKSSSQTASSIKLNWSGQGKNVVYQIYVYDTAKKKWYLVAQTNKTSYNVSIAYYKGKKVKLSANKEYSFRVRAFFTAKVNNVKYSKYGDYAAVKVRTKPKTPAVKKIKKSKTSLKATWGKISGVTGYEAVLATDSKFKKGVKKKTVNKSSATSHTFTKLKKGKTYYIRVRSYKTVKGKKIYSAYSKTVKVKL